MQADTLFINGKFVRRTDEPARYGFVAVTGETISAAGQSGEEQGITARTVVDLGGRTVIPGFMDSHMHLMATGLGLVTPEVGEATTADQLLDLLRAVGQRWSDREMCMVQGARLGRLDRRPDRDELDRLEPGRPLAVLDRSGHAVLVNTRALEWAADVVPEDLLADVRSSGFAVGRANTVLRNNLAAAMTDEQRLEALQLACAQAVACGLTTVHALEGGQRNGKSRFSEREAEILLDVGDRLPLRTILYYQTLDLSRVSELGLPRVGGCMWLDGSYDDHTAALFEPYHDDPSTRGLLYFSDEELFGFVGTAHDMGLQVIMHAIGDRAIDQMLRALEHAQRNNPRSDARHRIEHFSMPGPRDIERVVELGVCLGMQPNFAAPEGMPHSLSWLGPERFLRRHPYRAVFDRGIVVGGGTDSDAQPMDPLHGIRIITQHPDPERRLSVSEAFTMFTYNNARLAFVEGSRGTLSPGFLADMAVLNRDPFEPGADLGELRVLATYVGGRPVYEAKEE